MDFDAIVRRHQDEPHRPTLPPQAALRVAEASLPSPSSPSYLSPQPPQSVIAHISNDLVPAFNGQGSSSRYFGFVTGGVLPVAEWADNLVTRHDQNVQVHLPQQTIATTVEDSALQMLLHLLNFKSEGWTGRTFTTGATASNILGLACGREVILQKRLPKDKSVGEIGLLAACIAAGVKEIQVLTSAGHSSLSKAASVVGLGRASVKELARSESEPWRLDLDALEKELSRDGVASIIAISAADVNAGGFSLDGADEWKKLRELADRHGAWIHVDGGKSSNMKSDGLETD